MARFAHIALLALVAFAGAASASRGLKQNPGEALGLVMGDVLRGVAAGRPYTPGPLPSPFDASTNLANNLEALGLPNPLKDINAFAAALGLPSSVLARNSPSSTGGSTGGAGGAGGAGGGGAGGAGNAAKVPNPEIEVDLKPELTLGLGLGLTPLDLTPTLDLSATPLDLTLASELSASGSVKPSATTSGEVSYTGGETSTTVKQPSTTATVQAPPGQVTTVTAAQGAAQGFKNALSKLGN